MPEEIRVLIADDVADFRMLLRMQLERDGRFVVVGEAANGQEAVAMTDAERPDAVVLDIAMPEMDGLEAAKEIRAAVPETAIVLISGFGRDVAEERAAATGADLFVEKGGPPGEIADALADVLARRES